MAYKNYLIFDFGASNGRAIVARFDGKKFSMEVTHRFDNRPVYATGTLYWDILRLYSELKIGLILSVKKYKNIVSLGLDTWGADFGIIDKNGKLISNPVCYRDKQREKDSESLYKIISRKELFNLTAASIVPLFDLFHLYSLKLQNAPEILNAYKFLSIADIFNFFLTRKTFNEYTRFTTSILYNQREKRIEDSIFDRLSLPRDIFPPIIIPGEKVGDISNDVVRELEINPISVIAPATHDTASAVAGIPVINKNKSWAFISMGTWCILGKETKIPLVSDEIFDTGFSNEAGVEGTNLFVKNINGLWVIQQCREKWVKDRGEEISWDEIVNLTYSAEPFKSFIDIENPIFIQSHVDMPKVIIDYCRDKGQPVPETIGEIARCVYESLTLRFRYYFSLLGKFSGEKIELLHLVGGGIQNKMLCQWTADATGIPVCAGPIETTSVGNLLMQLKASGEIGSLEEGRKISLDSSEVVYYEPKDKGVWDEAYSRYLEVLY